MESLLEGKETKIPIYDFETNLISRYKKVKPQKYIILEGIFAFYDKQINKLAHFKIFVDTPADTCLSRRIIRDYKYRGRKVENIIKCWLLHVQPSYNNFIYQYKKESDIILPWHKIKPRSLKSIIATIVSLDKSILEILE